MDHWEVDTVRPGRGAGMLVTMNEKVSGQLRLGLSLCGRAEDAAVVIASRLTPLERQVKALTSDRGSEFAQGAFIEQMHGEAMYMADPHAPMAARPQRASQCLLRQYFPRSHDFSSMGHDELQRVKNMLNNRPRKRLRLPRPIEVFLNHKRPEFQG